MVVRLQQRETLAVVEFSIEVDGLDAEVKAVEDAEELGEDAAGGAPSRRRRHRQCVVFVRHACVQRRVGVERGRSMLRFGVVEVLCVVFVTVVGTQVEVNEDLYLLGKDIENISLEECVSDSFELFQLELRP